MAEMQHRDIYVRLSDPSGKHADVINSHSVWDVDLFVSAQRERYSGPKVSAADRRVVSLATKQEYRESVRSSRGYHRE